MWRQTLYNSRARDETDAAVGHSQQPRPLRRRHSWVGAQRWLLLALLLLLAVAALHLGHFQSGALTQRVVRRWTPQRTGLVVADTGVLLADVSGSTTGSSSDKTLSFDVCGGFAQQRVALISGLVLAAELNRAMMLPRLLLDDSRPADAKTRTSTTAAFGEMFDQQHFVERLQAFGVVCTATHKPPRTAPLHLSREYDFMPLLRVAHASTQHLRVDCPALKVPPYLMVKHEPLVFAAMDAMRPSQRLSDVISMIERHLQNLTNAKAFNVLHLKTEADWAAYCAQWESVGDGVVCDNCMNNTETVGDYLELHHVNTQVPLLFSMDWTQPKADLAHKAIQSLRDHKYKAVLQDDILALSNSQLPVLTREEGVLVEYYLALNCQQYVGNSVSVSSALLLMERWHAGRFATYYNGGNIPLEAFIPLYQMPWVFTYNDWSVGTEYDYMVKAAVTSGVEVARMKPYCMYSGSTSAEMYQWFLSKGVTIIQHTPDWKDSLAKEGARNREFNIKTRSHLYKSDGALVGTYQRIDIPILRQFDQYNYVLFTDCDVYFRQQMKLVDWGTPLPAALGMGYEMDDNFPYNAGIMLLNVAYMRKTNKAFVDWILAQQNGLYHEGYGAADQGAFNQFYEKEIRGRPINKNFNAMIYHPFRKSARIVHMHGPKPNHYLEWLLTGKCAFRNMCELGFRYGLCQYIAEYVRFTSDWEVATALHKLCNDWRAGTWHAQW